MKTLLLRVNPENPDPAKIHSAAEIIQRGGLVAFPTETVYGLGADALNPEAVLALFKAKKRPLDNPPIVHVADPAEVCRLVTEVPKKAEFLMEKFWPGPLTLIFRRSEIVPEVTVAGLDTVAIRMPKHKIALELIQAKPLSNRGSKRKPRRQTQPNYRAARLRRPQRKNRRDHRRRSHKHRRRIHGC